jgi:hypothetical protein
MFTWGIFVHPPIFSLLDIAKLFWISSIQLVLYVYVVLYIYVLVLYHCLLFVGLLAYCYVKKWLIPVELKMSY